MNLEDFISWEVLSDPESIVDVTVIRSDVVPESFNFSNGISSFLLRGSFGPQTSRPPGPWWMSNSMAATGRSLAQRWLEQG